MEGKGPPSCHDLGPVQDVHPDCSSPPLLPPTGPVVPWAPPVVYPVHHHHFVVSGKEGVQVEEEEEESEKDTLEVHLDP